MFNLPGDNLSCKEQINFGDKAFNIVLASPLKFDNPEDTDANGDGKNLLLKGNAAAGKRVVIDMTGLNLGETINGGNVEAVYGLFVNVNNSEFLNITLKVKDASVAPFALRNVTHYDDAGNAVNSNQFVGIKIVDTNDKEIAKVSSVDEYVGEEGSKIFIPAGTITIVKPDSDNDGIIDELDNCKDKANADQQDSDGDKIGDACDTSTIIDTDNDSILDSDDNCPSIANQNQADFDGDRLGNPCDDDDDADNIVDSGDNCAPKQRAGVNGAISGEVADTQNADQADLDGDGRGDVCDDDVDGDGILVAFNQPACVSGQTTNCSDNCPINANADQLDQDGDGIGAACDSNDTPPVVGVDADSDGVFVYDNNKENNCSGQPSVAIPSAARRFGNLMQQQDVKIELSPKYKKGGANTNVLLKDSIKDSIVDGLISRGLIGNVQDKIKDAVGDAVITPLVPRIPTAPTAPSCNDNCSAVANPDQSDVDGDKTGDVCDSDMDNDGVSNQDEIIQGSNPAKPDSDDDGVLDFADNCPSIANLADAAGLQLDSDGDGFGDACDEQVSATPTPAVTPTIDDVDNDTIIDTDDNCVNVANTDQLDTDSDEIGDACDPDNASIDSDTDGVLNATDNCKFVPNADQADGDKDGTGDACDSNTTIINTPSTGSGGCSLNAQQADMASRHFMLASYVFIAMAMILLVGSRKNIQK